jgi:acetyl esterase/lipase
MLTIQQDIPYKNSNFVTPYEEERCRLDLYSLESEPRAWLVWFHGGGLTEGDKGGYVHMAKWLAEKEIGVALCNYRFSPAVQYPAYVDDSRAAFDWLHHYLSEQGLRNDNIFVGGHSAGAYLAAIMALQPSDTNRPIRGVLPMSGQMVTHFTVRAERGLGPNQVVADEAAPIFHVREDAPPFCVMISNDDMPGRLEENAYFAAMMKVAGHTQTEFHSFAERDHGSISDLFASPGDPVCEVILQFIERYQANICD